MTAAISLVLVGSSGGASADEMSDGLWYYDLLHVQDAHDAGITGKGITVAVLDSPINLAVPTLAEAKIKVTDTVPCFADGQQVPPVSEDFAVTGTHGTNVASMIVGSGAGLSGQQGVRGVAPGVALRYYVVGGAEASCRDKKGDLIDDLTPEIDQAVADGADIISMSIGTSYRKELKTAIARAERAGVVLVFATTNHSDLVTDAQSWSQDANGAVTVQSADRNAQVESIDLGLGGPPVPNLDPATDVLGPGVGVLLQGNRSSGSWLDQEIGSGTSFATPIVAGFLADVWQKYPHATANQLIQTLIHNTGTDDHPLTYDQSQASGYGFVSLTHMLRVDPTQYPDKNPLLTDDAEPSPAEILGAQTASPAPSADASPASAFDAVPLIAVGVVGGLLVVGAVILIVVLAARRRRSRTGV